MQGKTLDLVTTIAELTAEVMLDYDIAHRIKLKEMIVHSIEKAFEVTVLDNLGLDPDKAGVKVVGVEEMEEILKDIKTKAEANEEEDEEPNT